MKTLLQPVSGFSGFFVSNSYFMQKGCSAFAVLGFPHKGANRGAASKKLIGQLVFSFCFQFFCKGYDGKRKLKRKL
jgi:hypothetical protein